MGRIDLTTFMESYRLAMVDLSKRFVSNYGMRLPDWDLSDEFEDISCLLFHAMVSKPSGLSHLRKQPEYEFPPKVVSQLRVMITEEVEVLCHGKAPREPFGVYSGKLAKTKIIPIEFSNFFDYDMMSPRPYEYVLAYSEQPLMPNFGKWLRIPVKYVMKYEYLDSGTEAPNAK